MQRVLFILDIVFYSTLFLCVVSVGFPWVANRFAPDIATEEVADGPVESIVGYPQVTTLSGCTMREVGEYSVEFDCPPGVWEEMEAWHRAFHPDFIHVDEP